MSQEEQDAAILRLVRQRKEARDRQTLLENELRTAGTTLQSVGRSLQDAARSKEPHFYAVVLSDISQAPSICNLDRIGEMVRELKDLNATVADLNQRAKTLGID